MTVEEFIKKLQNYPPKMLIGGMELDDRDCDMKVGTMLPDSVYLQEITLDTHNFRSDGYWYSNSIDSEKCLLINPKD